MEGARSTTLIDPLRALRGLANRGKNEALKGETPKTPPKDRRAMGRGGGSSLPENECLNDSPLCERLRNPASRRRKMSNHNPVFLLKFL
jgi:hypothetical protein